LSEHRVTEQAQGEPPIRGTDSYNESLFSTVRIEEFVPAKHPLRVIRTWVNDALTKMDAKFSGMYEADIKDGRPSIAPEKLMRAMLLQVLYNVRSERQPSSSAHRDWCFTVGPPSPRTHVCQLQGRH
jgi:transposase